MLNSRDILWVKRLYGDLEKRGNEAILALPSRDAGTFELVLLADLRPLDQRAKPPTSFLRFSLDPRALHRTSSVRLSCRMSPTPGPAKPPRSWRGPSTARSRNVFSAA